MWKWVTLVVKPPCGVPDGLVILGVRYWYTHIM